MKEPSWLTYWWLPFLDWVQFDTQNCGRKTALREASFNSDFLKNCKTTPMFLSIAKTAPEIHL